MSYASQQDMIDRYSTVRLINVTDVETPALGGINVAKLAAVLTDSDAVIDGYLVGRYMLPLSVIPAILKVHATAIAWYLLLGSVADEAAVRDYDNAIKYLALIAAGTVTLLPPSIAPAVSGSGAVLFEQADKVFGRSGCW